MSTDVSVVLKAIAYGVPALMVLGGIALLFLGLPLNHTGMINSGWVLIVSGAVIYIIEIILSYASS